MRARIVGVVASAAVVLVAASAALGAALGSGGARDAAGPTGTMMSSQRLGQWPDQDPGELRWQPRGWMPGMTGMMPGVRVATEYGFLVEMVAHHREAVTAARQLSRSDRAEMRAFGRSVVRTQSAQIAQMRSWLAAWYPHRAGVAPYRPMMRDLSALTGDRLDRAFLQDMIPHHMAAVMMSQQLLVRGLAEHSEVAALARTIRDEQLVEILQMRQWLRQWFGQAWVHGHARSDAGRGLGGGSMGPGMMAWR